MKKNEGGYKERRRDQEGVRKRVWSCLHHCVVYIITKQISLIDRWCFHADKVLILQKKTKAVKSAVITLMKNYGGC